MVTITSTASDLRIRYGASDYEDVQYSKIARVRVKNDSIWLIINTPRAGTITNDQIKIPADSTLNGTTYANLDLLYAAIKPILDAAADSVIPTLYSSQGYISKAIIKNSAGVFYGVGGHSALAAAQFIQVFDSKTLPETGDVPLFSWKSGASDNFWWDIVQHGVSFDNGIVVANSSTGDTYTSGDENIWLNVSYK